MTTLCEVLYYTVLFSQILLCVENAIRITLNEVSNFQFFLMKRCQQNFFRLHTKTFGGKIWDNLHGVSPNNIFAKKFK